MQIKKLLTVSTLLLTLGACDHVRTHWVSQEQGKMTVLEADAADKLVFHSRRGDAIPVTCSAQSPDAITSKSFSAAFSGGTPTAGGGAGLSTSQAAAYVGMRTQTIQLLRDGYFRLCEAYQNRAISKEQYNLALTSMPDIFVTIMAIDAVAGASVAPPVVLQANTPGVNTKAGLSAQGQGEGGAPASNNSEAGVDAAPGFQAIGAASRGGAMNKDGADVIKAVLQAMEKKGAFLLPYCASLLADSEVDAPGTTSPRAGFLQQCQLLVAAAVTKQINDATKVQSAEKTAKQIQQIQASIKGLQAAGKKPSAELVALQAKMIKLADDLAREAAKQPKVVAISSK